MKRDFTTKGGKWLTRDFCKLFGAREGEHGHDEPVLDDDAWDQVKRATPLLDKKLAAFLE